MNDLDPTRIAHSKAFVQEAFNHARGVNDHSEHMASRLLRDIKLIEGIVTIAELDDPNGNKREKVIHLMGWPAVKELIDRVNHLTSPELHTRLGLYDLHMAEGYMQLKQSIGQLELAVKPPRGKFEALSALADGPVVR